MSKPMYCGGCGTLVDATADLYCPQCGYRHITHKRSLRWKQVTIISAVIVGTGILLTSFDSGTTKPVENRQASVIDPVAGAKPENSSWDGSVQCVDRYLRETLNDYQSAEYVEWSPVTKLDLNGESYWAVRLKLRATNPLGAKVLKETVFFIRNGRVVHAAGL